MKRTLLWFFSLAIPGLVMAQMQPNQPATNALDVMQQFIQNPHDAQAVFDSVFTSNMRVPPEHLRVKFYDTRSGKELDRQQIREQMGAVQQDGVYALIRMAMPLLPAAQGLSEAVLQDLTDAAFIASMRNPPPYISIEFYDQRTGASGIGGGVSGRTPIMIYQTPANNETQSTPIAKPQIDSEDWIKQRYQQLEMTLNHPPGLVAIPVYGYGQNKSQSEQHKQQMINTLSEAFNLELDSIESTQLVIEDGTVFSFSVGHFKGDAETLATIKAALW